MTVDFSDPNRPPTCLEVDFPILPINQIAAIEGNAGKPIYQMSKWWARRRSSVFRALLLAASMKAPDDPAEAAKAVWDVYYANHQKKGALSHLKVADIFMGGGTTVVEGSRLGMQMFGCDINPVAWFVVKNELAKVDAKEVEALLADIEAEVKPQIMPFYTCDCPRGHRGKWTEVSSKRVMKSDFEPLKLTTEERKDYKYDGPEIIYAFWAKHGPCQVTGCGHRTPIMSSPVMAVKTLTVRAYEDHQCENCQELFDVEVAEARMAPSVALVVAEDEKPYAVMDSLGFASCPHCQQRLELNLKSKDKNKKVNLSLLVHPEWLAGSPKADADGVEYGGSATDSPEATAAWNRERASKIKLIEVRGNLPDEIICPDTKTVLRTNSRGGTLGSQGIFTCSACGTSQRFVKALDSTAKTAQVTAHTIQGYCPTCDRENYPYNGRFFAPVLDCSTFDAAYTEWHLRSKTDLKDFYPQSEIPFGHMTHQRQPLPQHGYTHWWKMFNPRQLLVHSQLLKAITGIGRGKYGQETWIFVLGAFQQYLRNQNMFCFWDISRDCLAPHMSNNNYHPKANFVENCIFPQLGRGNWLSCSEGIVDSIDWINNPWDVLSAKTLKTKHSDLAEQIHGTSIKVSCNDPVMSDVNLVCKSATELAHIPTQTYDLVITDPPFGGLLHYAELADFFYVWLKLALQKIYPEEFAGEYTPKALECVSNKARHPDDPDGFYQRLLTQCYREAHLILKPSGLLAFTFHHGEDAPWVSVLESLFDAGFYLEAAYPIRSDETKGEGEFGSKTIEYDIVHVCRKRIEEPTPVSWAKMRREVLRSVQQLKEVLEIHAKAGLPAADLQVIKRGKALEYYSQHYGKVYVDEGKPITVKEALVGINQLLDEESGNTQAPPPVTAEPFTRQFLRIFDSVDEHPRDQMQKYLRGTGISPKEFEERGWCKEEKKIYYLPSPREIAQSLHGKHRQKINSDYDQAMFFIGSCFADSKIKVHDTLNNPNFRPHPALSALLEWHSKRGTTQEIRNGAALALQNFQIWERQNKPQIAKQLEFFGEE